MDPTRNLSARDLATTGLAADGRSLDRLKLEAGRDPARAAKAAASQFEALFMQSLLRGLRDTIPKSGLTGGSATDTYTSLLDQQLAQKLAGRPGGLAEVIARQLTRHMSGSAATTTASPTMSGSALAASSPAGAEAQLKSLANGTSTNLGAGLAQASAQASASASSGLAALVMPRQAGQRGPAGARQAGEPEVIRAADLVRADPAGASPAVRAAAAAVRASEVKADALAHRQAGFVQAMWPHAVAAQRQSGTPAHLVIGQAALESGWGRRQIRHADGTPSFNVFGIKAGRHWTGRTVETTTTEFVDGKPIRVRERFRAYGSYAEAFADWSRLMKKNPRYEGVMKAGSEPGAYARQMQASGYATDPAYADKLEKTIRRTLALRQLVI